MGKFKSNYQTFEPDLLSDWLDTYAQVVTIIAVIHLLKYPISVIKFDYSKKFGIDIPSYGNLSPYYLEKIAAFLPSDYFADIEAIAKSDKVTQELIGEISALPDITEEQLEEQVINSVKSSIKNGEGFNVWLETVESILKLFGQGEFDEKDNRRIAMLRQWAEENGFMDPLSKRRDRGN